MNTEKIESHIENRWEEYERRRSHGRLWAGLFLLLAGCFLLLNRMNIIFFPVWFFTWPVLLMAIGFFVGLRHGFRGGAWFIMILVGGLFLFNQINPTWHLDRFIAPIAIIAIGMLFILRPRGRQWRRWRHYEERRAYGDYNATAAPAENVGTTKSDRRDFLDITAVFGGVKKNVLTKNFRGGDIVSFMGGSEIDLTQADFQGRVKIDATNIFGGTKLIVPPTWDVQSEMVAIFGGVDDKRQISGLNPDPNKVLVLDGTCLFGGIEIRSFK